MVSPELTRLASDVIRRLIQSANPEVAQAGAAHATMLWICRGEMPEEVMLCRTGSAGQRRGIALAAADLARKEDYSPKAIELLTPLLDSEDEKVRRNCDRIFHMGSILERAELRLFLESYIHSRCFHGNQWVLLYAFSLHTASLLPLADLLMSIIDVCAGPLLDASRNASTITAHQVSEIGPLLIRLYEQAEGSGRGDIQRRCLDAWDVLLERRVGIARQLMTAIDR